MVWALPARNISVYFVWGEWQNILIFVGEAHATVASGGLFKLAIKGRLKNGHSGFAWLQSVFSDDLGNEWKSSVGFAREKYIGLFCFWAMGKIS